MAASDLLYRETVLRFDEVFADSACVKSSIHYLVDWVLLRDATRTLAKAVTSSILQNPSLNDGDKLIRLISRQNA